jgi:hypothetical protein
MLQILSISLFEKVDLKELFGLTGNKETNIISNQGILFWNCTGQ